MSKSQPKPSALPVIADNIPAELKARPQWVCWKWELGKENSAGERKWTKVPRNAVSGDFGSSTNSATWTTFENALAAYQDTQQGYDGIGYCLSGEEGDFVGIDLDHCRDPQSGQLLAWTAEQRAHKDWSPSAPDPAGIIDAITSYAEVSPSGCGVRIICRGAIPDALKRGAIEIYQRGRYLTFTGHRLGDSPPTIESVNGQLDAVYRQFSVAPPPREDRPRPLQEGQPRDPSTPRAAVAGAPSVERVIAACHNANNGDKFRRLFDGDTSGYPSPSEADAALCCIVAFWSGGDASLIDAVFRQSRLYRPKWDERRGDSTYGAETVANCLAVCREFYDWTGGAEKPPRVVCGLELVTRSVRQTAAKTTVHLEVRRDGHAIDVIKLSDAAYARKAAAKVIAKQAANVSDAEAQIDAALGQILVEAGRTSQAAKPQDGAGGAKIFQILAEHVPAELDLKYRTENGRAYSARLDEDLGRGTFVELFTSNRILDLVAEAADAPRDDDGAIKRPQLIGLVERELKVLWGDLLSRLSTIEEADLEATSPPAVAFRQAIVSLWTRLTGMGIHRTALTEGDERSKASVQLATRTSLALRVHKMKERQPDHGKWLPIQEGFDAYARFEPGNTIGSLKVVLAMRFELADQIGFEIPNATTQTALRRRGVKFGVIDEQPTAFGRSIPTRMTGGGRLSVLSDSVTDQILSRPTEQRVTDDNEENSSSDSRGTGFMSLSDSQKAQQASLAEICAGLWEERCG